ncbi:sugar ABC transporter permease [Nocardioides sp.]|uniref:ABC transporter permease n=1 Tax=Nocardioides sp. TaxID=35761 RepID=UPI00260E3B0D|nr:sugar ABC transporter permease [Nocardioides sp.]MDI6909532.1 sugar ABC transporter permease [Nocardioides sp.]
MTGLRAVRPRPVRLTRRRGGVPVALLLAPALTVVVVFFLGGISYAVAQSLGYQPFIGRHELGLAAYRDLAGDPAVRASFILTLRVALLGTAIAAVLGTSLALLVHRLGRGRRWAITMAQANLAVPHLVGALAIGLLLSQTGLIARLAHAAGFVGAPRDFPGLISDQYGIGIVAEYVWKETPFLTLLALNALGRGTAQLGDAARVLGARPWQRLRHVTIPAVLPPLAAGSVLVFAFAVGSYEVPYLLGRPYPATLPVVAYQYHTDVDLTYRAEAMAIAVLITALSVTALLAFLGLLGRIARRPA